LELKQICNRLKNSKKQIIRKERRREPLKSFDGDWQILFFLNLGPGTEARAKSPGLISSAMGAYIVVIPADRSMVGGSAREERAL
jgi:hypothetical protein